MVELSILTEYHLAPRLLVLSKTAKVRPHFACSLDEGTLQRGENGSSRIMGRVIEH